MAHCKIISHRHRRNLLWATATLGCSDFGDRRRHLRAVRVLAQKATRPVEGILQGSANPASAKGSYRLLENPSVNAGQFWDGIHHHTAKSLHGLDQVYVIQDTTPLIFPGLFATVGLGTLGKAKEEALLMHSALAIRSDRQVLGLLYSHVWARPLEQFSTVEERESSPIEEKESREWLLGMERVKQLRRQHGLRIQVVHIIDRGGDVHEVFQKVLDEGDDCVIRSARNRRVAGPYHYLEETLAAQPPKDCYQIEVPRKHGERKRRAEIELRSTTVTFTPPGSRHGRLPISINVVWVNEPNPPRGVKPLDWLLLTTLPVETVEECRRVVEIYKCRWVIEDFHFTLKSGCRIEETQLKTAGRIEEYLALCCAVAVLILQLRNRARTEPDVPCTLVLSDDEWKVLWAYTHGIPVAQAHSPPTMAQAVKLIGRLGGHLGRKGDGMPGVRTLWRGWSELQLLVEGFHLNGQ